MEGLWRADALVRKARIDGVGSTISMAKKAVMPWTRPGWAWINVHERAESDGILTQMPETKAEIGCLH